MKKRALIFDIDGVVCDSSERFKRIDISAYNKRDKEKFVSSLADYSKDCEGDIAINKGIDLLHYLVDFYNIHDVYFITARGEPGRIPTTKWLTENAAFNFKDIGFHLIMHPENLKEFEFSTQFDHSMFKKEEARKILQTHEIVFAVDDGEENVKAYVSLQIPTLKFIVPIGRVLV